MPEVRDSAKAEIAIVCLAMVLCCAGRTMFSSCVTPIQAALRADLQQVGFLQTAYFCGYVLTNLPGGIIADRIGGIKVLLSALTAWSLVMAAHPLAVYSANNMANMIWCRFLVGAFSGVALPAATSAIATRVPQELRVQGISCVLAFFALGAMVGLSSSWFLHFVPWCRIFEAYGLVGVAFASFCALFLCRGACKSTSSHAPVLMDPILLELPQTASVSKCFLARQITVLTCVHTAMNLLYTTIQSWTPKYLEMDLHMDVANSGLVSALPWLVLAGMNFVGGRAGDWLVARGWQRLSVRHLMVAISLLGPAMCLVLLTRVQSSVLAVVVLNIMMALYGFSASGFHGHIQDVSGSKAGAIIGWTNGCGVLISAGLSVVAGHLADLTGSFHIVFELCAGAAVLGAVIFVGFARSRRLFSS